MMYRHLNTGVNAEAIETQDNAVTLKLVETGETKEVKLATFKRWWRAVTPETETQDEPEEPQTSQDAPSAAEPDETPAKETETPDKPTGDDGKALTMSEIVNKLEGLFDALNEKYFDNKLTRPIITVQSSPKAYGHCSTKKIWRGGADADDGNYEINMGAEFLNRPSEQTAATMLHEMVHLFCLENGFEDTCQNGRYHNKVFRQECEARDLIVEYDRTNGYATTKPSEAFIETLRSKGYSLNVPFARHTITKERRSAERTKAHKYYCPCCGQEVRTTQELSLICGICKVEMERAD